MKHIVIVQPKKQFMFYCCPLKAYVKFSAVTEKKRKKKESSFIFSSIVVFFFF